MAKRDRAAAVERAAQRVVDVAAVVRDTSRAEDIAEDSLLSSLLRAIGQLDDALEERTPASQPEAVEAPKRGRPRKEKTANGADTPGPIFDAQTTTPDPFK